MSRSIRIVYEQLFEKLGSRIANTTRKDDCCVLLTRRCNFQFFNNFANYLSRTYGLTSVDFWSVDCKSFNHFANEWQSLSEESREAVTRFSQSREKAQVAFKVSKKKRQGKAVRQPVYSRTCCFPCKITHCPHVWSPSWCTLRHQNLTAETSNEIIFASEPLRYKSFRCFAKWWKVWIILFFRTTNWH